MKYLYLAAALVVGAILFVGCSKDDDETNSLEEYVAQCQNFLAENAKREGVVTTASGLQYEVLREGREDGKRPTAESQVRCHYQGTFIDGRVFDSSYASGSPIVFPPQRRHQGVDGRSAIYDRRREIPLRHSLPARLRSLRLRHHPSVLDPHLRGRADRGAVILGLLD